MDSGALGLVFLVFGLLSFAAGMMVTSAVMATAKESKKTRELLEKQNALLEEIRSSANMQKELLVKLTASALSK